MALEIAAGRILAPSFGSTIYVWSAVISVTLLCLAVGYASGGRAADRWPSGHALGCTLALACAACVACFWLNRGVLHAAETLDPRAGALISAAVLLGLPLVLAGAVAPFCIRLASVSTDRAGSTAGHMYGASTLGGVVATLLVGFWTIPSFGAASTVHGAGGLLALAAAFTFSVARHRAGVAAGLGLLLAAALPGMRDQATHPTGAVLMHRESPYGTVEVIDSLGSRLLFVNRVLQTGSPVEPERIGQRSHLIRERYHLELLPRFRPEARRALLIGLGGGLFPRVMQAHGIETLSVEIDPVVAEAALEFFNASSRIVIDDGRRFLRRTDMRFDFIVIDAYSGEVPSGHLFSSEMFELVDAHLTPHGVLAINLIADPVSTVPRAVWHTVGRCFPHRRAYRFRPGPGAQPLTFFASQSPLLLNSDAFDMGLSRPAEDVLDILRSREMEFADAGALTITDDRNPVEPAWHRDVLDWRRETAPASPPSLR